MSAVDFFQGAGREKQKVNRIVALTQFFVRAAFD